MHMHMPGSCQVQVHSLLAAAQGHGHCCQLAQTCSKAVLTLPWNVAPTWQLSSKTSTGQHAGQARYDVRVLPWAFLAWLFVL